MAPRSRKTKSKATDTTIPDSKTICEAYFGDKPEDIENNVWRCKCGTQRQCDVSHYGYTNLVGHVKSKHPDLNEVLVMSSKTSATSGTSQELIPQKQTSLKFVIDPKCNDIYKWIDWIVMDELELSFCEQERTRGYTNLSTTCNKTLKKYMFKLRDAVKEKVRNMVAEHHCFALIFDGWTEDNTHFIGTCITAMLPWRLLTY